MQEEGEEAIPVVVNNCYGGFSLSKEAKELLEKKKEGKETNNCRYRIDPDLVEVVTELGERANGRNADLKLKYIPKKYANYYEIVEYDGLEDVDIFYETYNLDRINVICEDETRGASEKVEAIKAVLEDRNVYVNWDNYKDIVR